MHGFTNEYTLTSREMEVLFAHFYFGVVKISWIFEDFSYIHRIAYCTLTQNIVYYENIILEMIKASHKQLRVCLIERRYTHESR